MKKYLKKISALLMSVIMLLAMCVPAYAEENKPAASDKATITVSNVESGLTVTAYQVVKADYNDQGFTGYSVVTDSQGVKLVDISDPTKPTANEITAIAGRLNNGEDSLKNSLKKVVLEKINGTYSANVEAGYWVVIVTGSNGSAGTKVYNPMLLGVYYSVSGSDNTMENGSIDAKTKWNLNGTEAYAKSSEPTIEKKIVNPGSGNPKGDDVAIGDTVSFQVEADIPTYTDQYENITFTITDTLSAGLTGKGNVSVKVGGKELGTEKADLNYTEENTTEGTNERTFKGFTLTFKDDDYLIANAGEKVVITYSAVLNEHAGLNFDSNPNTVKLTYSNDPNNKDSKKKIEKKTYHYTFGIDANINGENSDRTDEIFKTKSGSEVTTKGVTTSVSKPLDGAVFGLYKDGETDAIKTATSGTDGSMSFTGLDAGTYYLQEITAPVGYTLSNVKIPVVITAEYNEDGTLNKYSITVDGKNTSTYSATYDGGTNITQTIAPTQIPNTQLSELPSTGGIGTYLFTIVGVVIMAAAAGIFFMKRRRNAE